VVKLFLAALLLLVTVVAAPWAQAAPGTTPPAAPVKPPAQQRPPPRPDPDAMREVHRDPEGGSVSARAIGHYLAARLKILAGDLVGAAEELRLAVAYDDQSAELRAASAEALAMTGRLEAAEAEARHALERSQEGRAASVAHLLLARIHAARQERPQAEQELAAAMTLEAAAAARDEPDERPDPEPWRVAADLAVQAGDPDRALSLLDDAVKRIGTDGGGLREQGRGFLERGDLDRAARALQAAVARRPDDGEAWRLLSEVRLALHRPREAHAALLSALEADPDDAEALLSLGRLALREDDLPAAKEWLERHLRVAPERAEPHLRVAFEWLEGRRPEQALVVAREGLALPAPSARLHLVEGLALEALRRFDEASTALAEVPVGAGDTWFTARAVQASVLARAGRTAEALSALDPALAARPGDPRLVITRAQVLSRAGRAPEAVTALQAVVADRERAKDTAALTDLLPALADALVRTGRADAAVALLEPAVAERRLDGTLRYALAAALDRAGRGDDAVAQMQTLLAAEPDHAEAMNFIGYLWAERGTRLEEAETLVRRALVLSPRSGHIVDSLGYVRLRRGAVQEAVQLLEEAERLSGPDPAVLDHLGDAYRAAGRPTDAVTTWRRALRTPGDDETPAEALALRASLERKLKELDAAAERKPVAR
jgi:tetratricopeptide (TPR) repeat protein